MSILYETTNQTLTCSVIPNQPRPSPAIINIQWTVNGDSIELDNDRIVITQLDNYTSELTFSPVSHTDSGVYECAGDVITTNQDVVNGSAFATVNFTVLGIEQYCYDY